MAKGANSHSSHSPLGGAGRRPRARATFLRAVALGLLGALATACGEYGGGGGGAGGAAAAFSPSAVAGGGGGTTATTEESVAAFSQTAYPMLRDYCVECHAGAGPGTPHIANGDPTVAHAAVMDNQKVSLGAPETSRLVRRLVADFHHCWSNCTMDGAEMQAAIAAWAQMIEFGSGSTQVEGIVSSSLTFAQGFEDEGQDRYRGNVIALYEFKEGDGAVARDTSGVAPAMDLQLSGDVDWISSYGLAFEEGRARASAETSRKLYDHIAAPDGGSQQYSVEAWVTPFDIEQEGPARMVSYSNGTQERNFTLGQVQYNYNLRNRNISPESDDNGSPALQTPDAEQDLQATRQHVVITYDQYRGRRIYVDGAFTDDQDAVEPTRLWNWSSEHRFVLGNESSGNRPWAGNIQLVAVYSIALSDAQIIQNYNAGIGKRLIFRFDVGPWTAPGAYLEFVVSEFDDGSYLFCTPTFVASQVTNARLANMRIAVNGVVPVSGQAFVNVDTQITSTRQEISPQCSIIPKDAGPEGDVFTLEFEYLGSFENPIVPPPPGTPPPREFGGPLPGEGIRAFARINETMAVVTGVSPDTDAVRATFDELEQQLASSYDVRTFSSSQQIAMAKLSLEYCNELVESSALRAAFFPGFDFGLPVTSSLATPAARDPLTTALVDGIFGVNVANQPDHAEVRPILDTLIDQLIAGCDAASCGGERTRTVAKAACAAVLSSAAVSMH